MTTVKKQNKKYGYYVQIDSYLDSEEREPEEYGAWSASSHHVVNDVYLNDDPNTRLHTVVSSLKFKEGDDAFVVWYQYSYGDSFGSHEDGGVNAMGIFKTKKVAEELAKAITNWDKDQEDYYKFKCKTSDGQNFEEHANWAGYFEHLSGVYVEHLTVKKAPR